MPEGFLADGKVDLNGVRLRLLDVFGQVSEAHVALAQECVVHGKCCTEAVMGVSAESLCVLEVFAQQRTVIRVSHVDKGICLLHGAFSSQVSHTILCNDSINEMAGMVNVRTERNDA